MEIAQIRGWVSPWLGVRFELEGMDLCLTRPDGRRFASYVEMDQRAKDAEHRAENAEHRAENAEHRAEQEKQRAEQEAQRAAVAESELARLRVLLQQQGIDFAGSRWLNHY